jgi:hypothetical protein
MTEEASLIVNREDIQTRAHQLWEEAARPEGQAEGCGQL